MSKPQINSVTFVRGDTVSRAIQLLSDGAVQSLAGVASATLSAKGPDAATRTATLTVDTGANTVTLSLSAGTSTGWPAGLHAFQVHLVDGTGKVTSWPQDPKGILETASLHVAERV